MIVADVFSTNPLSADSDHKYTWTGREAEGSIGVEGISTTNAFVVDIPSTPIDPSASLPVQVYLWSESAERGFVEKTSATIMMLLSFLIVMNFLAVYLRQKFEKRWN